MTTILYREITSDGQHTEIIEEFSQLDLCTRQKKITH